MGLVVDLIGTLRTSLRIAKATLDASGLTVARTLTLQDKAGKVGLAQQPILSQPAFSGSLAIDWSTADEIEVTLTGTFTPSFTGAFDRQRCMLTLKQDGTGSRLVTLPGNVRYGTEITSFTATTTAGKADRLGFVFNATDSKYDLVAVAKGY